MSHWYPKKGRVILHIDMNCFYASVEMAYNPELKGKPIAISGNPTERKGIIVTSSYEARAKGVKTTMPLWKARQLCPNLIALRPNFERYRTASKAIFKILANISPLLEPVSIDEGYLDITGCKHLGNPVEIAQMIQNKLINELDLPASIGIAPNKFLAKTASDMKKPLGLTILRIRDLPIKIWPLDIGTMYGIGERTADKLKSIGILTIGDLAQADSYQLKQLLGINGERLQNYANGLDERPVDPDTVNEFKSIGSSETLPEDTADEERIFKLMDKLATQVESRLKRRGLAGSSVQIMIRYKDRSTITRSRKLQKYIDHKADIFEIAKLLWHANWHGDAIRLLGVTVQDIEEKQTIGEQLDLFTYKNNAKKEKLYEAVEHLTEKYGKELFKTIQTQDEELPFEPTTSFQKDFLDDYKH